MDLPKNELPFEDIKPVPRSAPVLPPATVQLPRPTKRRPPFFTVGLVGLAVVVALAACFSLGWRQGRLAGGATPATVQMTSLELPTGATMIAQCVPGRGTQYILPQDIPQGPIYNVWQGKVVGIEFMFDKNLLLNGKEYIGLPLQAIGYNHINIGLLSGGHAGFEGTHYHMDVFTISHEEAQRITC